MQRAGRGKLRVSQRAGASPARACCLRAGALSFAFDFPANYSPGEEVPSIQLHLERHMSPGLVSSLFQAEFNPVAVGVNQRGARLF